MLTTQTRQKRKSRNVWKYYWKIQKNIQETENQFKATIEVIGKTEK